MERYIVEFYNPGNEHEHEFYACQADDIAHAQEQAMDAEPAAVIVRVYRETT